jgi:hypothetical protein
LKDLKDLFRSSCHKHHIDHYRYGQCL